MNSSKDSPMENLPKTFWQIRAEAERERRKRRIEAMSRVICDDDINFARYNQWLMIHEARWLRAEGIEIDARPDSDFLRCEVERFEAWNVKQISVLGLDKLSDEELLRHYEELHQKLVACYTDDENGPSEIPAAGDGRKY